ncbi:hypothetical protein R1flu_003952 [Riccia fluitans]|uniref:Uncharacterized protein n=1 Tax=Riccia fluitans TaxID=41844 RepID=A0ABD1YP68_9MARC
MVRPVANPGDPRRGLAPDRAAAEDASRQEGDPVATADVLSPFSVRPRTEKSRFIQPLSYEPRRGEPSPRNQRRSTTKDSPNRKAGARSNRLIPGERPASVADAVFTARRRIFPPAGTLGRRNIQEPEGLARRAQEWIRLHPFAARNTPALSYFETPSSRSDPTFTRSGARRSQPAPDPLAAARAALSSGTRFRDRS